MPGTPQPRRTAAAIALGLTAAVIIGVYLIVPDDPDRRPVVVNLIDAVAWFMGGVVLLAMREGKVARSSRAVGFTFLIGSAVMALVFVSGISGPEGEPGFADLLFLLPLTTLIAGFRSEIRHHVPSGDRRELATDAALIVSAVMAAGYVLIRPTIASTAISASAVTFALVTAFLVATYPALAIWVPTRAHIARAVVFAGLGAAVLTFGWQWTHQTYNATNAAIELPIALSPLAVVATYLVIRPAKKLPRPSRFARPILTSVAVIAACGALLITGVLGTGRGLTILQTGLFIGVLALAVAVRIIANQITVTQASESVRRALGQKEAALADTDAALDRVREANETLKSSEEHLRLVFDAAVDGIVELDANDVVVRTNEAFCQMVHLDRATVEGQRWQALAASLDGADARFAELPAAGQAQLERSDGTPLYLESRVSEIPTDPPRRLVLIRDVTPGKAADQTIRSLLKFLQEKDEDRTSLLRRTNSAIESERNRIARDLHDGPVQGVSAASLSLEAALLMIGAGDVDRGVDVLSKVRKELADEADALRALMSGLRPPVLEERGLIPALREAVTRFGIEQNVETDLAGTLPRPMSSDLETLAYRVVQEALTNAAKHARADRVVVSVETTATSLRVEVEDDGRGFDSAMTREFLRQGRVGLASMRERVELANGTFVIRSNPGRGTSIVATLPVDAPVEAREGSPSLPGRLPAG
ncbi:MAG TPA: PAS domain-containing sensor histidine kinase [Actinomycetota bacterium]|nr:PAS domain-containing sensor histidine kinase [Actinomycetota bacterium]